MSGRGLSAAGLVGAALVGASLGSAVTWFSMKGGVAVVETAATPLRSREIPAVPATATAATSATWVETGDDRTTGAGVPGPAPSPESPASPAPSAPDPVLALAAAQRAHAVVDSAIARHEWTAADAAALREEIDRLSPDAREDVLRRFAVAVNRGALVPRVERIPF